MRARLCAAGEVFVDGYGVGDVGAVVLRDRKHLAEDGMVVVVLPISAQNGDLLAEPEIITRGFIYVKDSEELLQDLRNLTMSTAEAYRGKRGRDLNELKGAIRSAVSNYLFKATKRSRWFYRLSRNFKTKERLCRSFVLIGGLQAAARIKRPPLAGVFHTCGLRSVNCHTHGNRRSAAIGG